MGTISPVSSATGMKSAGETTPSGTLPAAQRLKPSDLASRQANNRLIVNAEFSLIEGLRRSVSEPQSSSPRWRACPYQRPRSALFPVRLARYMAISASRNSSSARTCGAGARGDSDARRDHDFLSVYFKRRRQLRLNSLRHPNCLDGITNIVKQDGKFIAAEPGQCVIAGQPPRRGAHTRTRNRVRPPH